MTERQLSLLEVRPAAEWLTGQDTETKEHQFGRFFGGLGPALGIHEPEFSETFQIEETPPPNASAPETFFMRIDIQRLDPELYIRMGAIAGHDGFELVPTE